MKDIIYDIWFSDLDIPNECKLKLLENHITKEIWNLSVDNLANYKIGKKEIHKILNGKSLIENEKKYEIMLSQKIDLISFKDEKYPQKLLNIYNFPAFIYIRGNTNIFDNDSAAIVGCRNATKNGENVARNLAKKLADNDVTIISGLAVGIDKFAHLGALDSRIGKTVAVLGGGINNESIYPFQNKRVFERILEQGGAIISEYGIFSKPEKEHFPLRNRIISGLADKVIVVEAKKRSGALITANLALEQGKDVYAFPRKYIFKK